MTQLIKHFIRHLPFLTLFLLLASCDPKDPNPQPQKLDLSCIQLFDENGQDLGLYGSCTTSPDWGQIALSSEENAFLNFNDTVSTTGTVAANITEVSLFPNPAIRDGALLFLLRSTVPDQPVKLKLAIVNEDKTVLAKHSLRVKTNQALAFQLLAENYPPGKYYRVYYRVSAQSDASLFEGYGNILICKQQVLNGDIDGDCF